MKAGVATGQGGGAGRLRELAPAPALTELFVYCENTRENKSSWTGRWESREQVRFTFTRSSKNPQRWHLSCDFKDGWGRQVGAGEGEMGRKGLQVERTACKFEVEISKGN